MTAHAWIYVIIGAVLVVAAAPYGFARSETARRKAVDRLAKRIDLAVPTVPVEAERVGLRLATRERFIAVGGGIGLVAAVLAALFLPAFDRNNFSLLGIFLLSLVGIGVGAGLSALRTTRELPDDVPRIARLSSPTVRDYLMAFELNGAVVTVIVGVLITVVTLPFAVGSGALQVGEVVLPAVVALVAVVSLVAALVLARSIVQKGQRAGSVLELAWDDAIRSIALRDLISIPLAIGFASTLVPLVTVVSDIRLEQPYTSPDNMIAVGALAAIGAICLVGAVLAIVALAVAPQRHYRRRLWPEPAATSAGSTASAGEAAR
jgi:hypothetical protein